ncbi:MAG: hypothetical protein ACREOA_04250 [Candidatus Dormibacteria bacterium]
MTGGSPRLRPLPPAFLEQLAGHEELLVSSRDRQSRGTVPMWFAVVPPGYVYLLTPTYTRKAQRWQEDQWVRLRIPGTSQAVEGGVEEVAWEEAAADVGVLTQRFALAGAVTPESLRWMLQDGSRRLLRAGLPAVADSAEPGAIETLDRG